MTEKLFIGDKLIGELEWGPGGDFPWAKGSFIPSDEFQFFTQYVEVIAGPDGLSVNRLDILALETAGYKSADLKIIDGDEISYLVGLDYYADGTAYWRFSMSPFDGDE